MGGRSILIILGGVILLSTIVFYNISRVSVDMSANADATYLRQTGRNIAQTGVNLAVRQLLLNRTWRGGFSNKTMMGGKVSVSLRDTTFDGIPAVSVAAVSTVMTGTDYEVSTNSTAFVRKRFQPPGLQGALSSRNPIYISGTYTIDGRNHTPGGALIADATGVPAVWTTKTMTRTGNCFLGGTVGGVDYAPAKNLNAVLQNQSWPGGYPGTPDSVLGGAAYGFPEGTLKQMAQSGVGGSQYTTNPATLALPLKGITYVELPNGAMWQYANTQGTGIIVVHNAWGNARFWDHTLSSFTGLIIVDDFNTLKGSITGGAISLAANPSSGQTGGEANGTLLYSREVIEGLTQTLLDLQYSSDANIIAWKE